VLEGWEIPFYVGMWGSIVLFSVAMHFLPDTSLVLLSLSIFLEIH